MIDGIPDDVYAFCHRPLTPKEAEVFERHLEDQRAKKDEDGCVEAVQVALTAFPDAKIKSVTHANTGTKLEFENPAQIEKEESKDEKTD